LEYTNTCMPCCRGNGRFCGPPAGVVAVVSTGASHYVAVRPCSSRSHLVSACDLRCAAHRGRHVRGCIIVRRGPWSGPVARSGLTPIFSKLEPARSSRRIAQADDVRFRHIRAGQERRSAEGPAGRARPQIGTAPLHGTSRQEIDWGDMRRYCSVRLSDRFRETANQLPPTLRGVRERCTKPREEVALHGWCVWCLAVRVGFEVASSGD
jgi:hypothetical protein